MTASQPKTVRQQFADTMLSVGMEDPKLVVLVGDVSHFILQPFAEACPGRFYNIGICEPTIASMGAGLAKAGLYPVLHTIAPFLIERSFEQLKLDFCYQKLGGTLVTVGGAFDYGHLGCTHHCYDDWALLTSLPGTEVICPSSPLEFDRLFRQTYHDGALTLFRLPQHQHSFELDAADINLGQAVRITEGKDVTIVIVGPHVDDALQADRELRRLGHEAEIIYVHTIKPLDTGSIRTSMRKTRHILVLEEHIGSGGVGEKVLHVAHEEGVLHVGWIGIPEGFIREYRSYAEHCQALDMNSRGIVEQALTLLGRS